MYIYIIFTSGYIYTYSYVRILRILQHTKPCTKTTELYIDYGTLPINILFKFQLLLFAHSIYFKSDNIPTIFCTDRLTNSEAHTHSTRAIQDFHRSSENSSYGSKISVNLYSKLWNLLPSNLKSTSSPSLFKNKLKIHLFSEI
jgi:hypothetical protein